MASLYLLGFHGPRLIFNGKVIAQNLCLPRAFQLSDQIWCEAAASIQKQCTSDGSLQVLGEVWKDEMRKIEMNDNGMVEASLIYAMLEKKKKTQLLPLMLLNEFYLFIAVVGKLITEKRKDQS